MKFLVCISNVPDTTTKISFTPDNKEIMAEGRANRPKTGGTFMLTPSASRKYLRLCDLLWMAFAVSFRTIKCEIVSPKQSQPIQGALF